MPQLLAGVIMHFSIRLTTLAVTIGLAQGVAHLKLFPVNVATEQELAAQDFTQAIYHQEWLSYNPSIDPKVSVPLSKDQIISALPQKFLDAYHSELNDLEDKELLKQWTGDNGRYRAIYRVDNHYFSKLVGKDLESFSMKERDEAIREALKERIEAFYEDTPAAKYAQLEIGIIKAYKGCLADIIFEWIRKEGRDANSNDHIGRAVHVYEKIYSLINQKAFNRAIIKQLQPHLNLDTAVTVAVSSDKAFLRQALNGEFESFEDFSIALFQWLKSLPK